MPLRTILADEGSAGSIGGQQDSQATDGLEQLLQALDKLIKSPGKQEMVQQLENAMVIGTRMVARTSELSHLAVTTEDGLTTDIYYNHNILELPYDELPGHKVGDLLGVLQEIQDTLADGKDHETIDAGLLDDSATLVCCLRTCVKKVVAITLLWSNGGVISKSCACGSGVSVNFARLINSPVSIVKGAWDRAHDADSGDPLASLKELLKKKNS